MKILPLLLVCTLAAASVCAQYPLRVEPVFRNYGMEVGLPNLNVYGLLQDRKGYIWVATNLGVSRFNGYNFERFPDTLQCNFNAVLGKSMTLDESGRLWFAISQFKVFYIENDRIVPWKHNDSLKTFRKDGNFVNGILVKGNGDEIWLGAAHSGIIHADRTGKCKILPGLEGADRIFFQNQYGGLSSSALGNYDKLFKYPLQTVSFNGDTVQVPLFPFTRDSLKNINFRLYFDNRLSDGGWLWNFFGTYFYFKNNRLVWRRKAPGEVTIWTMQDDKGRIFTGHHFGGGLKVYASLDDFCNNSPTLTTLHGQYVTCIIQDREGGYWIGTREQGVYYCESFENGQLSGLTGLEGASMVSIVWDLKTTIYIAYSNGQVFAIDKKSLVAKDISPPHLHNIHGLVFDEQTQILGLAGPSSALYKNGRWETVDLLEPVSGRKLPWDSRKIVPGRRPDIWFSISGQGLAQINIRTKKIERSTFNVLNGTNGKAYTCIQEDQSGRVWACNRDGLVEWVGEHIVPADTVRTLFKRSIKDIKLLPDTTLVFCPRGYGIVLWKPGHAPLEITGQGKQVSNWFHSLYYDPSDSSIWAAGWLSVNKIYLNRQGVYQAQTFTPQHNLSNNPLIDFQVIGNDLWLAMGKGLYRMDHRADPRPVPSPVFHALTVNNFSYPSSSPLVLPHDSSDLSIDLLSLYFRGGDKTYFAYRLLDNSGDTSWTVSTGRRLSFLNLAPGSYRLEVKTRSEANTWSPISTLAIRIRPPWWATWWARGAFAGLLALLAYAGYRYRIRQVRTEGRLREEMLRLEIAALQARMNPHFIFNCLNSIQSFILDNEPDAAVLYLAKFAKLVRGALNASANGAVSVEEEAQMLDHYLALERLRFNRVFDYRVTVDPKIDPENTFLPPLIVQPFVENAVLHGMKGMEKDGRVEVAFGQENGYLRIDVCDNGAGMQSPDAHESGNISHGRSITLRRLELIRQQNERQAISVEYKIPEEGRGTHVSIRLPQ